MVVVAFRFPFAYTSTGMDTNFATKLALKARAVEEWQHLTNEDQPEVNLEQDIISTTHLLDMMSKKDEKAYTALEVKGVPSAQKGKLQYLLTYEYYEYFSTPLLFVARRWRRFCTR